MSETPLKYFNLIVVLSLSALLRAEAAYTNISHSVNCTGARSTSTSYENVSSIAQPGGITIASTATRVNYAGYLNTFSAYPNLDTDGDGLPNEVDADNDDDGLNDTDELDGNSFAPPTVTNVNDPDSDDDGMNDGDEANAGTNPLNGDDVKALHVRGSPVLAGMPLALDYGTHYLPAGTRITNSVLLYGDTETGITHKSLGWKGTGSVPLRGREHVVAFTLTEDSALTWLWLNEGSLIVILDMLLLQEHEDEEQGNNTYE